MDNRRFSMVLSVIGAMALGSETSAQDNSLFIVQENSGGRSPNSIFVDQSSALQSEVGSRDTPTQQIGGGNSADVTISGIGSRLALTQDGAIAFLDGNSVTVDMIGMTLSGSVDQVGSGNSGSVSISGTGNAATLTQNGRFNQGTVSVSGLNTSGTLRQTGNNNDNALLVDGSGTDVTYSIVGNNLSGAVPPSIVSNGATVVITQTTPGGVR